MVFKLDLVCLAWGTKLDLGICRAPRQGFVCTSAASQVDVYIQLLPVLGFGRAEPIWAWATSVGLDQIPPSIITKYGTTERPHGPTSSIRPVNDPIEPTEYIQDKTSTPRAQNS